MHALPFKYYPGIYIYLSGSFIQRISLYSYTNVVYRLIFSMKSFVLKIPTSSLCRSGLSTTANLFNKKVLLAKRPIGLPTADTWTFASTPVESSKEGGIVVKVSSISLDPAMRGWLNDVKSYIPPVAIGDVMRAGAVGTVLESKSSSFKEGDFVMGGFGVQQFCTVEAAEMKKTGVTKINSSLGSSHQWLNCLGMPGMTAYFGLKEVGLPKAGETIVVSAAAGAVGQTVGQLAKIYGLRVIGIAGGKEKCEWVVSTLGFDGCIDYKSSPSAVKNGLKEMCPNGVDIFFDNVGGDILDTVLTKINRHARIVICGAISQYNTTQQIAGPKNYLSLLVNRARMEGMVVFDYASKYGVAVKEISEYLSSGKLKSKEHVVVGIENFPTALNALFAGENFGKLVLDI
jgi:NADPH-dependent curcumin reductase CurA